MNSATYMRGKTKRRSQQTKKTKQDNKIVTVCPHCYNMQQRGQWYAPDSRMGILTNSTVHDINYRYCPACEMQLQGLYAGVLYLQDIPDNAHDSVIATILHEAEQACLENAQHRLLEFVDIVDGYAVTTTSPNLAVRLGRKIQATYDTSEIRSRAQSYAYPLQTAQVVFRETEYFK